MLHPLLTKRPAKSALALLLSSVFLLSACLGTEDLQLGGDSTGDGDRDTGTSDGSLGDLGLTDGLAPVAGENCGDGIDNDSDDTIDCFDSDCIGDAACTVSDTCPNFDLGQVLPAQGLASTIGMADQVGAGSCGDANGSPDVSFSYTAPNDGPYTFSTEGSSFDTVLHLRDANAGCAGTVIVCNDDTVERTSEVTIQLTAGQTVIAVVDGWQSETGDVVLRVSGHEAACGDGIDNDGDGSVDCEDSDCVSVECTGNDDWPADWAQNEFEMLEATNAARAQNQNCGGDPFSAVGPLTMNSELRLAARLHSYDMGQNNYFEHESLDGRQLEDRISDAGYTGNGPWGENLQAGSSTAADSVARLMNSPGHCRNIMNGSYREVGMGYAYEQNTEYGHYWTQNFGGGGGGN